MEGLNYTIIVNKLKENVMTVDKAFQGGMMKNGQ